MNGVGRMVTWLLVIGALALAVTVIAQLVAEAVAASPPPPADTYRGRSAHEWAQIAAWRTVERDRARAQRTRLRLGLLKLRRAVRSAVARGDVFAGLRCLQGFEGSWRDSGAPYWGGLQMDRTFMQTYGRELYARLGTADRWPPQAQLAVGAIAVHSGRGFGPWPQTRRYCGL